MVGLNSSSSGTGGSSSDITELFSTCVSELFSTCVSELFSTCVSELFISGPFYSLYSKTAGSMDFLGSVKLSSYSIIFSLPSSEDSD
jgi:hypothetical protein